MNFQSFPFDSHECVLDLKNWIGETYRVILNSPKILTNDENGNEIAGKKLTILSNTELDYNFYFETLPTSVFVDDSLKYSMAQVKMNFDRTDKSRTKIFSGYHAQTATFALLSLVSFSINLDSVPGRMGMLILLYLIQINTYNSFKGGLIFRNSLILVQISKKG